MTTETLPDLSETDMLGEPCHVVCCLPDGDDDLALCGADVSNEPRVSQSTPLTCTPCVVIAATAHCPIENRPCPGLERV